MIRGAYRPVMLPVATPQGEISALVFTSNPAHPEYVGELPLPDTAAIIARAAGVMGTNRDYLEQMARQLAALEIHDDYVAQLVSKVREIHGG
jgi:cation transport protein ChaC